MTGGYNNVGFRVLDGMVVALSDVVTPFLEMYRIPTILLGLTIFVVAWLLLGRWLKG